MKRHIPGLRSRQQDRENLLEGLFLVRVEEASYCWHPQKPFFALRLGNQPFISDFRGFIFSDVNTGARLFGNRGELR